VEHEIVRTKGKTLVLNPLPFFGIWITDSKKHQKWPVFFMLGFSLAVQEIECYVKTGQERHNSMEEAFERGVLAG
jgi:hypothetical protein